MTSDTPVIYSSFSNQNHPAELHSEVKEVVTDGGARCYSLGPIPFSRWAVKRLSFQQEAPQPPQSIAYIQGSSESQALDPGLAVATARGRNVCTEGTAADDIL